MYYAAAGRGRGSGRTRYAANVSVQRGKPLGLSGALMIRQKPYVMATKTRTTRACPTHSGSVVSASSSSLLAIDDWSGKVVP
jgi:hypothetical protein